MHRVGQIANECRDFPPCLSQPEVVLANGRSCPDVVHIRRRTREMERRDQSLRTTYGADRRFNDLITQQQSIDDAFWCRA